MSISSDINSSLSFLESVKRRKLAEESKENTFHAARDKFLGDKRSLSRDVAYYARQLLPEERYKSSKAGGDLAPHMAIDNAFADADPMKGIGDEVMAIAGRMQGKDLGLTGDQVLEAVFEDSVSRRLGEAYRYNLKQETSPFGSQIAALPGYEQFKQQWEQDPEGGKRDIAAYAHGVTPKGLATNAALLTGMNIAAQGVGVAAKKAGWRTVAKLAGRGLFGLPAVGAPGFATKLAGLALMSLADFAMFDAGAALVGQSHWAKARADEPLKTTAAEMLLGGAVAYKGAKSFKKLLQKNAQDKAAKDTTSNLLGLEYKPTRGVVGEGFETVDLRTGVPARRPGGVPAVMSYAKASKDYARSSEQLQKQIGHFARGNKDGVRAFELNKAGQEQELSIFDGIQAGYDDVVDVGFKESPALGTQARTTNLLPAPIEKSLGPNLSRQGRTAMRMFYDHHKQKGTNPVIKLWEHGVASNELSGRDMNAIIKYWSNHPGSYIPPTIVPKAQQPLIAKINNEIAAAGKPVTFYNSVAKAQSYGLEGKSYTTLAKMLDTAGTREAVALTKEGIPPEVGVVQAATKSQARKANKTSKVREKRDADIVAAAKSDAVTTTRVSESIIRRRKPVVEDAVEPEVSQAAKDFAAFRKTTPKRPKAKSITLTPEEETRILSGGVEASRVPKEIGALIGKGKKVKKLPEDATVRLEDLRGALLTSKEFTRRQLVVDRLVEQLKLKHPGSATVPGKTINDVIKAARKNQDVYGKPLLRQRSALSKEPSEELTKIVEDEQFLNDILKADPSIRKMMLKGLALVPLTSVALIAGTGEEAEAGIMDKTTVLAGETAKTMFKEFNKSNLIGKKGDKLGRVERWMDGFSLAPGLDAIKQQESKVWSFLRNHVMTTAAVADLFYKKFMNPGVELASRMTAVHNNSQMHAATVDEILSLVPGFKGAGTEIRKAMKPLTRKYEVPIAEAAYHSEMLKSMRADLKRTSKKKDPELWNLLDQRIDISVKRYNAARESLKPYHAEWETTVKKLASEHSSTRMALAIEDTAEFKYYPWLKNMLDPNEQAAVSMLKDLNKVTQGRIEEAGGDVIKHRPFAHHALHPDTSYKNIKNALGNSTTNMQDALAYARLHSRSIGSRMMMPDVEFMYSKYIPDVERRLQMMKFWKKGQRGGWDAHRKDLERFGLMSGQLREFWKLIDDGFKPPPQTKGAEWARRYYSLEVLRLLFMSPSVGFKHLMKQTGDIAIFGPKSIGKRAVESPRVLQQVTRSRVKERWPEMFPGMEANLSEEAKFVKAVTNQGRYQSAIAELEFMDAPINRFDEMLHKFNETGSIIVGTIENLDRTATVLAGMEMAAKKGLTPNQAIYSIYDSILRANFLSGPLNPKWIRDPYARAFFMFQGTPYKLMEQRILRASKAGKDIKKAFGITLNELKDAKNLAKEGEFRVKAGLVMDALTETKDVYGTPVTKQFMVNVLTLGGIIGAGDMIWDADLADHVIHPPFFKPGSSGVGLALNPAISAGYKAWHTRHEEDSELMFTEFFNKWMSSTGVFPSTFTKSLRLSRDDIPEIYRGDKWKYIFAVPAAKED